MIAGRSRGLIRGGLVALALMLAGVFGAPALAQGTAANDAVLLQYLRQAPNELQGRISIPDPKAALLIQPDGREYRENHARVALYGGLVVLGFVGLIAAFFLTRGRIRIEAGRSTRTILRFGDVERFAHWLTASTFVVLGLSGLNMLYGKSVLLPIIGPDAFTALTLYGKYAHNFLSFPFCLGLVMMLAMWLRHNIPDAVDVAWFKAGGGLFTKGVHPPARKFNGGQKIIFWSTILVGAAIAVTGYILMFPFQGTTMADMQLSQLLHAIFSLVLIGVILGHIYIGSLGMEGAFDAMGKGTVDLNWAKEHHSLWVKEVEAAKAKPGAAD